MSIQIMVGLAPSISKTPDPAVAASDTELTNACSSFAFSIAIASSSFGIGSHSVLETLYCPTGQLI